MIKVGIFGAASLTAGKLIELLLNHVNTEITVLVSETFKSQNIEKSFRGRFKNLLSLKFESYDKEKIVNKSDIVFLSKPHLQHHKVAKELLQSGVKVIDLSADFRIKDANEFQKWYKVDNHDDFYDKKYFEYLDHAVYGLPEIYSNEIANANLVANPGCYPTSVILGLAPLFENKIAKDNNIIVDSYSGVSGAGKSRLNATQFIDLNENIKPYKFGTHNHTPEMEQELSNLCKSNVIGKVLFTPHVVPMDDGIASTIYLKLKHSMSETEIFDLYNNYYKHKSFVRIYEPDSLPHVKDVIGTNFCDIGITFDKRTNWCVVTSVIDNTIKGAAGQAIQNMNIMFGLDEVEGLPFGHALKKKSSKVVSY